MRQVAYNLKLDFRLTRLPGMARGHRFSFDNDVCVRCGISRAKYERGGLPRCKGQPPEKKERSSIPDDDPPEAA